MNRIDIPFVNPFEPLDLSVKTLVFVIISLVSPYLIHFSIAWGRTVAEPASLNPGFSLAAAGWAAVDGSD
jgi:hypothetical protein